MFSKLLAQACVLGHLWFDDFRWREFFLAMSAIYGLALKFAGQINVPERHHQTLAMVAIVVAAVMYILNPKSREWADKISPSARVDPGANPFGEGKGGDI